MYPYSISSINMTTEQFVLQIIVPSLHFIQLNSEAPSQCMYCISHVVKHVTMDTV